MDSSAFILHYNQSVNRHPWITDHWCQDGDVALKVQLDLQHRTNLLPYYTEVVPLNVLIHLRATSGLKVQIPNTPMSFYRQDFGVLNRSLSSASAKGSREGGYYKIHASEILYCVDIPTFSKITLFSRSFQ
jgi:hypothetical protein